MSVLEILFSSLNEAKKLQNFLGLQLPPSPLSCIWNKANLLANALLCSDFSQYALFFQSLINAGFLLLVGPDILMNVLEDCIIFLYLDSLDFVWFLSEFTLTKIWFMKKYKQQESWSNKNHPHKLPIHWICSTPSIISNTVIISIMENIQILVICFSLYIFSN